MDMREAGWDVAGEETARGWQELWGDLPAALPAVLAQIPGRGDLMTDLEPSTITLRDAVRDWIAAAREKLAAGALQGADLEALERVAAAPTRIRQRLLYLYADSPDPR